MKKRCQKIEDCPMFINGKYSRRNHKTCIDCGKELSSNPNAERCHLCANIKMNKDKTYEEIMGIVKAKTRKKKLSQSNTGYEHTKESKRLISLGHGGTGIPYEDNLYSLSFFNIRESIRDRDGHECQNCNKSEEQEIIDFYRKLSIHHIDYNKMNCLPENLITLCTSCNIKANYNKDYWFVYYTYIMENKLCLN
jgi:hypothetical protein